jgi:hypothetical protein
MRNWRADRDGFMPFWLNPIHVSTMIVGVSLLLFLGISDDIFRSEFRQPRGSAASVLQFYVLIWLTLVLGMATPRFVSVRPRRGSVSAGLERLYPLERRLAVLAYVAAGLSLVGYVVYVGSSNATIELILAAVSGQEQANYLLRDSFEKVPGITSLMNLACWWFFYIAVRVVVLRRRLSPVEKAMTLLLIVLSIFRGFAVNERRVIFEILIPGAVACMFLRRQWSRRFRKAMRFAPIYGAIALVVIFVATEYFRSWVNFWSQGHTELDYFTWALVRLAGYYATALNNGVAIMDADFGGSGIYSLAGIVKFPVIGELLASADERALAAREYGTILLRYTNPEFNNQGGAIVAFADFGLVWGVIFLYFVGLAVGAAHRAAMSGSLVGVMFYSTFFFSLLEVTRTWNFLSPIGVLNLLFVAAAAPWLRPKRLVRRVNGAS